MKKIILLLFIISYSASAQYKYAVGIRFDDSEGLTFKNNKAKGASFEAMLSGFGNGLKGTLLAEWHQKAFTTGQWRWFYGAGGHVGSVNSRFRKKDFYAGYRQVGLDGILGLEVTFNEVPINLSVDWKPEFNFINYPGLYLGTFGLSARFAIKR
jgi:hypothetical protein